MWGCQLSPAALQGFEGEGAAADIPTAPSLQQLKQQDGSIFTDCKGYEMIYMVVGDGNKMILVSEDVSDAKKCGLNRTRWMLS